MSFPMKAFRKTTVADAPKGALLRIANDWWVRTEFVTQTETKQMILALTGAAAGSLSAVNYTPALAIAEDYAWEIRVRDPVDISTSPSPSAKSVVIGTDGNYAVWGHVAGAAAYTHGFLRSGDRVSHDAEMAQNPVYAATNYQVWLLDAGGEQSGTEPLFEVRMSAQ